MTYKRVSLSKKNSGAPSNVSALIRLYPYDDIATFPARGKEDVLVTGDITLKQGAKGIGIYATQSSISRPDTQDGEADEEGYIQTLVFTHPGNYLQIEEFKQKWLGEPFIAITDECGDGKPTLVHGWNCNPLYFTMENQRNNEASKSTFTFAQRVRGNLVAAFYEGEAPEIADEVAGAPDQVGV